MIAIIDYDAGNTTSVINALKRLDANCVLTNESSTLFEADKVILPGVGSAGSAMQSLKESGLHETILSLQKPFLGICLGLQLMCNHSEEDNTNCLGIFDAKVKRFPPKKNVPHMGWNDHSMVKGKLFNGLSEEDDFYFVHSYYAENCPETIATCDYILEFASAIRKDNFYGVQFHPEKSAAVGEQLLRNFLSL